MLFCDVDCLIGMYLVYLKTKPTGDGYHSASVGSPLYAPGNREGSSAAITPKQAREAPRLEPLSARDRANA